MVQKHELRIGNILLYNEYEKPEWGPERIKANDLSLLENLPLTFNKNWKPIPLTEKVLLACGFEKKGTTLSYVISFHKFNVILRKVEYNKGYHFELELIGKLKRIESLHALQNLFFCITGAELTIDINKLEG